MGLFDYFKKRIKNYNMTKMLNGDRAVFTQFGNDVYASDVVLNCVRCIATEISKLQPKHIRTDSNSGIQKEVNSDLNRLLKFGPNPLMTTSDFLEKIVWLREKTKNCFIYPSYVYVKDKSTGKTSKKFTGLWPLNPVQVDILQDELNTLFLKFYWEDGTNSTLPYNEVIHWRKDFNAHNFMGGPEDGVSHDETLLKTLKINETLLQGIDKSIKASFSIRGIIKINSMMNDEKQEEERTAFEKKLNNSKSGILPIDMKSEYIPLDFNPVTVDKEILEFIQYKILNHYGVSLPILRGDFTEEEFQAFYEKTLEPMVISLGRSFSKVLFSEGELNFGNEIVFYDYGLNFTNTANKIKAVDILSRVGVLTGNQIASMFGFPPYEGGEVRIMSLNYINKDIADSYQMSKFKKKVGESNGKNKK
ncbi:phage portal protein [Clostridium perfringens]|uniref:Portal protein n=1 Tax=Clostridium perfringens TaxID=1502 RepID=A0A2X3BY64_CLOPF|nr:phage portal protein [Clostridium perfringens]MDC4243494.1 phage portal protein [Clostridium perfringens]MDJ8943359.1 phage portal protein [Clostridium perfringens]MDM0616957.1 phage portal protein [Clostridium perfringens]MDU4131354.1 phage portal protein [Clostridium perfringens]MDU5659596.1 phage portal protein [Clostridium perfringens]